MCKWKMVLFASTNQTWEGILSSVVNFMCVQMWYIISQCKCSVNRRSKLGAVTIEAMFHNKWKKKTKIIISKNVKERHTK